MNKKYSTIYLVRHGETEWNKESIIQGHLDSPLTSLGILQAQETSKKLEDVAFDVIYSSDLERAYNTARIIVKDQNTKIKRTKHLRERDYGRHSGKKYSIFQTKLKKYLSEFESLNDKQKWVYKYPSIESDNEIAQRTISFLKKLSKNNKCKTILVVTHAGVIGNLLIHLKVWDYKDQYVKRIDNASYLVINSDGIYFTVEKAEGVEI